jgi:hypothetical protein
MTTLHLTNQQILDMDTDQVEKKVRKTRMKESSRNDKCTRHTHQWVWVRDNVVTCASCGKINDMRRI